MASTYTCKACSRALLRASKLSPQAYTSSLRAFATTTPFQQTSAAPSKPPHPSQSKNATSRDAPTAAGRSSLAGIAAAIRERAPMFTETYVAYGATEQLLKECAKQGDYKIPEALEKGKEIPTGEGGVQLGVGEGWWYDTLGLQPTFASWSQITFLHMYLLQVRFRMFPATHSSLWIQNLTNHAFYAAEDRLVVYHHINANGLRQRYLKDMFTQWRAVLLSYDEGLVKGDAVLATAIWRNLLGGKEDVDAVLLAQIVGYLRRELARLDKASDDEVASGSWVFGEPPGAEAKIVGMQSRGMMAAQAKQ